MACNLELHSCKKFSTSKGAGMSSPAQCSPQPAPRVGSGEIGEAFNSAEEAWLWTMAALIARAEGARSTPKFGKKIRPCEPDDIIMCLDALYKARRISLAHARILRVWGARRLLPDPTYPLERADSRLWNEAIRALELPLRIKGIVTGSPQLPSPGPLVASSANTRGHLPAKGTIGSPRQTAPAGRGAPSAPRHRSLERGRS